MNFDIPEDSCFRTTITFYDRPYKVYTIQVSYDISSWESRTRAKISFMNSRDSLINQKLKGQ